jgi:hypothetical protein
VLSRVATGSRGLTTPENPAPIMTISHSVGRSGVLCRSSNGSVSLCQNDVVGFVTGARFDVIVEFPCGAQLNHNTVMAQVATMAWSLGHSILAASSVRTMYAIACRLTDILKCAWYLPVQPHALPTMNERNRRAELTMLCSRGKRLILHRWGCCFSDVCRRDTGQCRSTGSSARFPHHDHAQALR